MARGTDIGPFAPVFRGEYRADDLRPDILDRLALRVARGRFLPRVPPARNRYAVIDRRENRLRVQAVTFASRITIGLNDVLFVHAPERRALAYRVVFGTWAGYVAVLSAAIALPLGILLLRGGEWARRLGFPHEGIPEVFGLALLLFWCVVFPGLMTVLHKRAAARALVAIVREENAGARREGTA